MVLESVCITYVAEQAGGETVNTSLFTIFFPLVQYYIAGNMARLVLFLIIMALSFFGKTNNPKPYKYNRINSRKCNDILLCADCYIYSSLILHILYVNFQLQYHWDS